jgi:LCP family protein required for cell wall assembly
VPRLRRRQQTTRRGGQGVTATVATGFLVFLIGVAGAAGAVVYSDAQVRRVQVDGIAEPGDEDGDGQADLAEIPRALNILLVGMDSRDGLTREERNALRLGHEADGDRTDTIMLARIDPDTNRVGILSFPRDLYVTRCDGTQGRINGAHLVGERSGVGGPSCLVETVTGLTGIPVHHYVEVDLNGFVRVVDTLGGVTMYLEEPLYDERANLDLEAGCVALTPADALAFVRARYLDDDFGRIARQQRFLREVAREVTSAGVLLNPPRMLSLVDTFSRTVQTDQELSLLQMRRIAFTLRDADPEELDTRTVPAVNRTMGGVAYVVEREEEAAALYEAFRTGVLLADDGRAGDTSVQPGDVPPLRVLNGAGVAGLAAEAGELLEQRGFTVAEVGDAPEAAARTQVRHHPDRAEEAAAAAQLLDDAELVVDETVGPNELAVVLGADYEPPQAAPPPAPVPPVEDDPARYRGAAPVDPAEQQC